MSVTLSAHIRAPLGTEGVSGTEASALVTPQAGSAQAYVATVFVGGCSSAADSGVQVSTRDLFTGQHADATFHIAIS